MPAGLRERYEQFLEDPEILTHTREIAALKARQTQLMEQADDPYSFQWADKVRDKIREIGAVLRDQDMDEDSKREAFQRQWDELERFADARPDMSHWFEIQKITEQIRRLKDSEMKRRVEMHYMVKVEDALTLILGIVEDLKPALNLDDKRVRDRYDEVIKRIDHIYHRAEDPAGSSD